MDVIQNLSNMIASTPSEEWTLGLARVRLEMLEGYWMDFQSNHLGLIHADEENDGYDRARSYTKIEQLYERGKAAIYDVQERQSQEGTTNRLSMDGSEGMERQSLAHSRSRLPRINLPEFSGKREEWESFRDLYRAMVHNDLQLSNVEKLYYLKTLVKGEARAALEALQLTEDNYDTAWDCLEERYEHRRILVYGHLRALGSLKPAREESVQALQALLDTLRRHRDQLKALDRPVDHWDDWFVSAATGAMDPVTRRAWEDELERLDAVYSGERAARPGHELASFEMLSKFLNSRCRVATAFPRNPSTSTSRPAIFGNRNTRSLATRSLPAGCTHCQADHYVGRCEAFMQLEPGRRLEKITQARLCFNCLRPGHPARSCPSRFTCQKCQSPHHTLLHDGIRKRPSVDQEPQNPLKTRRLVAATEGESAESPDTARGTTLPE